MQTVIKVAKIPLNEIQNGEFCQHWKQSNEIVSTT